MLSVKAVPVSSVAAHPSVPAVSVGFDKGTVSFQEIGYLLLLTPDYLFHCILLNHPFLSLYMM